MTKKFANIFISFLLVFMVFYSSSGCAGRKEILGEYEKYYEYILDQGIQYSEMLDFLAESGDSETVGFLEGVLVLMRSLPTPDEFSEDFDRYFGSVESTKEEIFSFIKKFFERSCEHHEYTKKLKSGLKLPMSHKMEFESDKKNKLEEVAKELKSLVEKLEIPEIRGVSYENLGLMTAFIEGMVGVQRLLDEWLLLLSGGIGGSYSGVPGVVNFRVNGDYSGDMSERSNVNAVFDCMITDRS